MLYQPPLEIHHSNQSRRKHEVVSYHIKLNLYNSWSDCKALAKTFLVPRWAACGCKCLYFRKPKCFILQDGESAAERPEVHPMPCLSLPWEQGVHGARRISSFFPWEIKWHPENFFELMVWGFFVEQARWWGVWQKLSGFSGGQKFFCVIGQKCIADFFWKADWNCCNCSVVVCIIVDCVMDLILRIAIEFNPQSGGWSVGTKLWNSIHAFGLSVDLKRGQTAVFPCLWNVCFHHSYKASGRSFSYPFWIKISFVCGNCGRKQSD